MRRQTANKLLTSIAWVLSTAAFLGLGIAVTFYTQGIFLIVLAILGLFLIFGAVGWADPLEFIVENKPHRGKKAELTKGKRK